MSEMLPSDQEFIPSLGITGELVKTIRNYLSENNHEQILAIITKLHPADLADLIEQLPSARRHDFINVIHNHLDPEVFSELEESILEEVIDYLSPKEVAAALSDMDSDEVAYILEDLDEDQQQQILNEIPAEERISIEKSLSYPDNSAGRLMQAEVVLAPIDWTIGQIIDFIECNEELPERFYDVYITDDQKRPIGIVALDNILRHPRRTPIKTVMDTTLIKIPTDMDQEEVAYLFEQYGLFSAPVIDHNNNIVGMITINDIVHVVREESQDDFMKLGLVTEYSVNPNVLETSWQRLRWLFVSFLNTLIAAKVISHFEPVLSHTVSLAFLMPIVAAMGGNAGMQVITVTVRALANRDLLKGHFLQTLRREVLVAMINGTLLALLLAGIATLWFNDFKLGLILGASLIFNIVWSAVAGISFPFLLNRLGLDPAISSGPLLTTTTDVLGFACFLGLATLFLLSTTPG